MSGFAPIRIAAHGLNPVEIARALRGRAAPSADERVSSSYALNAYLSGRRHTRALKRLANGALSLARLGDGLKVYARPR